MDISISLTPGAIFQARGQNIGQHTQTPQQGLQNLIRRYLRKKRKIRGLVTVWPSQLVGRKTLTHQHNHHTPFPVIHV